MPAGTHKDSGRRRITFSPCLARHQLQPSPCQQWTHCCGGQPASWRRRHSWHPCTVSLGLRVQASCPASLQGVQQVVKGLEAACSATLLTACCCTLDLLSVSCGHLLEGPHITHSRPLGHHVHTVYLCSGPRHRHQQPLQQLGHHPRQVRNVCHMQLWAPTRPVLPSRRPTVFGPPPPQKPTLQGSPPPLQPPVYPAALLHGLLWQFCPEARRLCCMAPACRWLCPHLHASWV